MTMIRPVRLVFKFGDNLEKARSYFLEWLENEGYEAYVHYMITVESGDSSKGITILDMDWDYNTGEGKVITGRLDEDEWEDLSEIILPKQQYPGLCLTEEYNDDTDPLEKKCEDGDEYVICGLEDEENGAEDEDPGDAEN